jgi:hypothetical protein
MIMKVSGSDTLDKGESFYRLAVWTNHPALGGTRGADNPFEIEIGHNILQSSISVTDHFGGIKELDS